MPDRWRHLAEHNDDRRYEGIAELHLRGIKPVNANDSYSIRKVALQGRAIIDVHEFRRNEPGSNSTVFHPSRADQEEVHIESGQAVDGYTCQIEGEALQALFVTGVHMVVTHVRRVGE